MDPTPIPRYLRFVTLALTIAAIVFVALPFVIRFFDPTAGGFSLELFNVPALAALLLLATLHLGFYAYGRLFPRFKSYQQQDMEGEGSLMKNLTDELREPLYEGDNIDPIQLNVYIERRKVAQFQFLIRCVRLAFCLVSLFFLLWLAQHMLTVAMLAVPGNAPASLL
ncbi:hypothetical protein [Hymenobacter algoricola]|uniref:Uncharacterized protein n=1 Tax=Hymenobacter algoricola TaxID=486267 RepID=A0ABP7NWK6_9BACT